MTTLATDMPSKDLSVSSELELSDFETQFIPQEDDDQLLWKVIEITAEKGKKYKVKWAGVDPKTMKPWPQEWVAKHDCTGDIVMAWKVKQAKKRRAKEVARERKKAKKTDRPKSRASAVSKVSMQTSNSSSMTATRSSAITTSPNRNSPTARSSSSRTTSTSKQRSAAIHGKRKHSPEPSEDEAGDDAVPMKPRAKKRRVEVEAAHPVSSRSRAQLSIEVGKTKRHGKVSSVDGDGGWDADADVAKNNKGKGKAQDMDDQASGEEEEKEDDDPPSPATITKIGPPRGAPRPNGKLTKKMSTGTVASTSSKKPSTSKGAAVNIAPKTSSSSKVNKQKPKSKARVQECVESDSASGETVPHKPLKGRFAPGLSISEKAHPQQSINAQSDDEVVEDLEAVHKPKQHFPLLSPRAKARLAVFDAMELTVEEDLPRHSPARVEDSHDLNDNMHDEHGNFNYNDNDTVKPITPKAPLSTSEKNPHAIVPDPEAPHPPKRRYNGIAPIPPSKNNSYRTGIVPETETESTTNNTQSQPEHHAQPPSSPTPVTPSSLPQSPSTPQRTSVKSRMKPRTPGSSSNVFPLLRPGLLPNADANVNSKPLQRVPIMSPSRFLPHLPSSAPSDPVGSNVESVIEPAPEAEEECPLSSIEQFTSPEKGSARATYGRGDRMIRERGQELADMVTQQRQSERKQELVARKMMPKSLSDVFSEAKKTKAKPWSIPTAVRQDIDQHLPAGSGAGPSLVGTNRGAPPIENMRGLSDNLPEDAMVVQEMEDRYVDLDGGGGDGAKGPGAAGVDLRVLLRQEEEESSQELIAGMDRVGAIVDSIGRSSELEMVEKTEGVVTSSLASHDPGNSADDDQSALGAKDPTRWKAESKSRTNSPALPATQSEEISRLEEVLKGERDKIDGLAKEIISLQDTLAQSSAVAKSDAADLQQQLTEAQGQREKDRTAWDGERSALVSSLDTLTCAKLSAEADRDFFREQYTQASGYVSSVRVENQELEARAAIAENQAKDGVGMIRNTFQERVKKLESELARCKGLTVLLMEKDKRTGDEIRRKAGEEPELRARCGHLGEKAGKLVEENSTLQSKLNGVEREKEALEQEMQGWREEMARVDMEVRAYKTKMERLVASDALEGGDDLAYRCEWRLEKNAPCEYIFSNTSDLQEHLVEEHLR